MNVMLSPKSLFTRKCNSTRGKYKMRYVQPKNTPFVTCRVFSRDKFAGLAGQALYEKMTFEGPIRGTGVP